MKLYKLLPFSALLFLLGSCASNKNQLSYFKDLPQETQDIVVEQVSTDYALRIIPDDELLITVNSLNPQATAMFNLPLTNAAQRGEQQISTSVALQTFIVNEKGDIRFPQLGVLHVEGMTTRELTDTLVSLISHEVENPMVRVEIVNYAVNIMGDVKTPGRYNLKKESTTVLDALAMAGDLTEYGKRNNVLLIRREGDKTIYHRFDLADANSLNSPYFYLKQNDVLYVEPDTVRASNAKYNTNNSYKLSVISTVVSACSVIASLIIALTR